MTDVTTMTPAEIDRVLADIWYEQQKDEQWLWHARDRFNKAETRGRTYDAASAREQIAQYRAKLAELDELEAPYFNEYTRRGRWQRYFLVSNTNGHVHRGMNCTTCYDTTQYQWLVDLADCDEKQMVADYGELACTVCFPEAPTFKGFGDGTSSMARLSAAEKQARADAKAERAAKKAAKTLNTPVRVQNRPGDRSELITTVYGAKEWIKGQIDMQSWGYGLDPGLVAEGTAALRWALAEKGIDVEPMIAKWMKQAAKEAAK